VTPQTYINGLFPPGRAEHILVALQWISPATEDSVMVFGGRDDNGVVLNDFWKLQFVGMNRTPIHSTPHSLSLTLLLSLQVLQMGLAHPTLVVGNSILPHRQGMAPPAESILEALLLHLNSLPCSLIYFKENLIPSTIY